MTLLGWAQIALVLGLTLATAPPLGRYMFAVVEGRARWLAPLEWLFYGAAGVDPARGQDWRAYTVAMLAFNALMITIGTHPISASPGAPLSLDAPTQPVLTVASLIGIVPLIASSYLCLRALLLGEELDFDGLEDERALRQRLFAAFLRSIDAQARMIRQSIWSTGAGGVAMLAVWVWILTVKMG